jgi:hypothetical protein
VEITGGGIMRTSSSPACYTISSRITFSGEEGTKIGMDCSTKGSLFHVALCVFFIVLVVSGAGMRMVGVHVFYYYSIH